MKKRHNKKRNTVFLFEALVRELTKSIVEKNQKRTNTIKTILKEHFAAGSALGIELECFKTLCEESSLDPYTAEKLLFTVKKAHSELQKDEVFRAQSLVIREINATLGSQVYQNFVPNYRAYATVAQLFNEKVAIKTRVLLEKKVIETLISSKEEKQEMKPVDELVMRSFSNKFNEKYSSLHEEQQKLLGTYITSLDESQTDFKVFFISEAKRIRDLVEESFSLPEVVEDEEMVQSTKKVLEYIDNLHVNNLGEKDILKLLKLQDLVREYRKDANQT
jgi:hypothetical protein|tara:strand:- start:430 stop:1260 length:831 start_codon:yes stop_codon:yes gene_type:complete